MNHLPLYLDESQMTPWEPTDKGKKDQEYEEWEEEHLNGKQMLKICTKGGHGRQVGLLQNFMTGQLYLE